MERIYILLFYIVTNTFDVQKQMYTKHGNTKHTIRAAHQQCLYNAHEVWCIFKESLMKLCFDENHSTQERGAPLIRSPAINSNGEVFWREWMVQKAWFWQ